jgi:hypothetical protein
VARLQLPTRLARIEVEKKTLLRGPAVVASHKHFGLSEDELEEIAALHRSGESALTISRHLGLPAATVADYTEYYDLRQFKKVVNRISGAAFIVGIGMLVLSVLPLPFWPGILFVLGMAALIRAFARYHRAGNMQTAAWMFGLGLMFMPGVDFNFTGVLVLIGFSMVAGILFKGRYDDIDEDEDEEDDEDDEDEDEDDGDEDERERRQHKKRKNEELTVEGDKPKRGYSPGRLRLSDDGELIEAFDIDEEEQRASRQ